MVVVLVAALALSGCTTVTAGKGVHGSSSAIASDSPTAPPTTPPAVPAVAFKDCSGLFDPTAAGISAARAKNLVFSCGNATVPQNYADLTGATLSLFVLKVHDKLAKDPKVLMVNPGGPGASGAITAVGLAGTLADEILTSFDIVGFDPRGVGLSSPVTCAADDATDNMVKDALFAADPDVRTADGLAQAASLYQPFTTGCITKYGAGLADYNTIETAQDMELLRKSLGNQPLNYLGYSYGTRLGAVYASLFPTAIRTAVLDGAVDPVAADLTSDQNQLAGFEQAFDQFAADCATRAACSPIGDPRSAVQQLLTTAAADGIANSNTADPRRATTGRILSGVAQALYSQSLWADLGAAILAARKGDGRQLIALSDQYYQRDSQGKYTNLWDANTAVLCNDNRESFDAAQIQQIAVDWGQKYPLFGVYFAGQLFQCVGWPPSNHPVPDTVKAAGSKPIVVVGTVHDPATPYAGATSLVNALGTGVLLSWDGEGHTAYGGKSACIDKAVNAYLIADTVPAANITCPAK